jgi:hypothetical protein
MPDEPNDNPANDKPNADPTQAFQRRLDKYEGDAMKFATALYDENWQLREKNRQLEGKAPSEGSVVLSKTDAERWESYKALGKPDELKQRLDAHATLETQLAEMKQKDVLREVADLHGYKLSVLLDRDKAAGGLKVEIKDDAKGVKTAFVKDGDKEAPITEFAQQHWADYLPSLKVETATQPRAGNGFDPKPKVATAPTVAELKAQKLRSGQYY